MPICPLSAVPPADPAASHTDLVRIPEYLPRPEWFVDVLDRDVLWLDDTVQYSRQSFQNRTRFRNADGFQWLTVPVGSGQFGRSIADTVIQGDPGWRTRHRKALKFNYESAPYFLHYEHMLAEFWSTPWTSLGACTCRSVRLIVDMLRLPVEVRAVSESGGGATHPPTPAPASRVTPEYRQNFDGFIGGMSAIDLILNHGPDALQWIRTVAGLTPGSTRPC